MKVAGIFDQIIFISLLGRYVICGLALSSLIVNNTFIIPIILVSIWTLDLAEHLVSSKVLNIRELSTKIYQGDSKKIIFRFIAQRYSKANWRQAQEWMYAREMPIQITYQQMHAL